MSLFALPIVGRAGLGNELLPWARAELFAHRSGARMMAPKWARLRLGPYLRREPDKRTYIGFFNNPDHVRGPVRAAVCAVARRVPEGEPIDLGLESRGFGRPSIVEFRGLSDYFQTLTKDHLFVRNKLWSMTVESLRPQPHNCYGGVFVAMHVRRGDLTRSGFSQRELEETVHQYTPVAWFVAMARAVRRVALLREVPIVVFTDGSSEEVKELLSIEGVRLHRRQPAIADLWILSNAKLLFASGFSTFGMWASFLGGMPTVYARGKLQQPVQCGRRHACEVELHKHQEIPDEVLGRLLSTAVQSDVWVS